MFERHAVSEVRLGLAPGSLIWRGPFDPTGDRMWADMIAGKTSERDYWARRAAEVGRLFGEDWDVLTLVRRTAGDEPNALVRPEAVATARRANVAGLRVGVLSSELDLFHGREDMEALEIMRAMDSILDATRTRILRLEPRAYALGCQALGVAPQNVVLVDDQMRNVEGARRAGLDAVWRNITRPTASFAETERRLGLAVVAG